MPWNKYISDCCAQQRRWVERESSTQSLAATRSLPGSREPTLRPFERRKTWTSLLRREHLPQATAALEAAGFIYRHSAGLDVFLDGREGRPRSGVRVIFANEKVRADEPVANPDVAESEPGEEYRILSLEPLVRVKLTAFRRKDQMHLIDLIQVGLIDSTWPARFLPELGSRLQELLDTPEG